MHVIYMFQMVHGKYIFILILSTLRYDHSTKKKKKKAGRGDKEWVRTLAENVLFGKFLYVPTNNNNYCN